MSDDAAIQVALFELTGVGVVQTDMATGRFVRANRAFCEMVGYSEDELLGMTYLELTHSDDRERDAQSFAALGRGELHAGNSLTRVVRKDGAVRWLELHITLLGEGTEAINLTVVNDVTERRQAEVALRDSEEKYRTLFSSIDEGFCLLERVDGEPVDFRYLEANPAFTQQIGVGGVVGKTIRETFPGAPEEGYEIYERVWQTGEPVRAELDVPNIGHVIEFYAFRVQDGAGRRLAVVFQDVTESKRAEEALRASEERFRLFVTASSDMVYRMSADWSTMVSLEGKRFLADTRDPSLTWLEAYIPDNDKAFVQAAISEAVRTKTAFESEHRVFRVDGTVGWVFSRAIPFLDESGEIFEWFGAASDITERKRAEERQAFLLKLGDALRPISDPGDIQIKASHLLGENLRASRVLYIEVGSDGDTCVIHRDYVDGVSSVAGRHSLSNYEAQAREKWLAGQTVAHADVEADESLSADQRAAIAAAQVRAWLGVPLLKNGRLVAILAVHQSVPRAWLEGEIGLVTETAERTWAAALRASAEEALRENQERLTFTLEFAQLGNWELDLPTGKAHTSFRHDQCFGVTEPFSEWSYETFLSYVHPDDRDHEDRRFRKAVASGKQWQLDCRVVWADGSVHWIESTGRTDRYVQGTPTRMLGIVREITERKRTEANLAFLAEVSEDLAHLTNIDETMNALGEKLSGYFGLAACAFAELQEGAEIGVIDHDWHRADMPSLLGTYRMQEFVTPEVLQRCRAGEAVVIRDVYGDPMTDGEQYAALNIGSFVSIPLVRGGEWRFLLVVYRSEPYDWREDEIELLRELTHRIWTRLERARTEAALQELNETLEQRVLERTEALRHSEQRFSEAFYINPIPACMTTLGRETFVEVNAAFLALTGYEHDEVVGHSSRELAMWSSPEDQKKLGEAQRDGRGFRELELELRTKAGDHKNILISAEVIRLDGHEGYLKMFYDITERKRTEEQLHQAIGEVMTDTSWFSHKVMERLAHIKSGGTEVLVPVELSKREREVLERLAGGVGNAAIAAELGLSPQTVRNYITNIYDKLGVHSRAEAVVWARERGIVGK